MVFGDAEHQKSLVRSQSGSPNSQKLPPSVYMPAAAMLTEQKPPCAAKFGVPNCVAQKPVSDWLWSRPVKKASFFGSSARIVDSQPTRGRDRLVPFDLAELAGAALADPQQRLCAASPASAAA